MNKSELVAKIANDSGLPKAKAQKVVDTILQQIVLTLKSGGSVTIKDLGTFSISKRAVRYARNPQTGAVIKVKAKNVAKFKPSNSFQSRVGGGGTDDTGPMRK